MGFRLWGGVKKALIWTSAGFLIELTKEEGVPI